MIKSKGLLLSIVTTNLLCTFAAGHGIFPLGLLEFLTLFSIVTFNFSEFELLSFWTLTSILIILGQIMAVISIKNSNILESINYGRIATILMALSIVVAFLFLPGEVWEVSFITTLPFIILTIVYWWHSIYLQTNLVEKGT